MCIRDSAINRGEKEGKLRVHVRADADAAVALLEKRVVRHPSIFADQLRVAVADGYKRLDAPALARELRAELTERAQTDAIRVFARNTESLLSQRPVRGARVIALDPGYRTGCKVAVLDESGALLDHGTVFPTPPRSDVAGTTRALCLLYTSQNRITEIRILEPAFLLATFARSVGNRTDEPFRPETVERVALHLDRRERP